MAKNSSHKSLHVARLARPSTPSGRAVCSPSSRCHSALKYRRGIRALRSIQILLIVLVGFTSGFVFADEKKEVSAGFSVGAKTRSITTELIEKSSAGKTKRIRFVMMVPEDRNMSKLESSDDRWIYQLSGRLMKTNDQHVTMDLRLESRPLPKSDEDWRSRSNKMIEYWGPPLQLSLGKRTVISHVEWEGGTQQIAVTVR